MFTLIDFCEKATSEAFVMTVKIRVASFGNLCQYAFGDYTFGNPEALVVEVSKQFGAANSRWDLGTWNVVMLQVGSSFGKSDYLTARIRSV